VGRIRQGSNESRGHGGRPPLNQASWRESAADDRRSSRFTMRAGPHAVCSLADACSARGEFGPTAHHTKPGRTHEDRQHCFVHLSRICGLGHSAAQHRSRVRDRGEINKAVGTGSPIVATQDLKVVFQFSRSGSRHPDRSPRAHTSQAQAQNHMQAAPMRLEPKTSALIRQRRARIERRRGLRRIGRERLRGGGH
jgi:hypothetical protein